LNTHLEQIFSIPWNLSGPKHFLSKFIVVSWCHIYLSFSHFELFCQQSSHFVMCTLSTVFPFFACHSNWNLLFGNVGSISEHCSYQLFPVDKLGTVFDEFRLPKFFHFWIDILLPTVAWYWLICHHPWLCNQKRYKPKFCIILSMYL